MVHGWSRRGGYTSRASIPEISVRRRRDRFPLTVFANAKMILAAACAVCCDCGSCPKVEFEGADSPCTYCIAPNIYCADSIDVGIDGGDNCTWSGTLLRESGPICCDCHYRYT